MLKKLFRKAKEVVCKGKETVMVVASSLVMAYMTSPISVYAAAPSYTAPLTKLKTVAISIVAAAGVIVLIYGGVKFATSFQKMDQNGEHQAVYTIIAAGVMIGISAIVAALS